VRKFLAGFFEGSPPVFLFLLKKRQNEILSMAKVLQKAIGREHWQRFIIYEVV